MHAMFSRGRDLLVSFVTHCTTDHQYTAIQSRGLKEIEKIINLSDLESQKHQTGKQSTDQHLSHTHDSYNMDLNDPLTGIDMNALIAFVKHPKSPLELIELRDEAQGDKNPHMQIRIKEGNSNSLTTVGEESSELVYNSEQHMKDLNNQIDDKLCLILGHSVVLLMICSGLLDGLFDMIWDLLK
ncbi:hypothetical protein WICPIJ_001801 [Wickerhamomyces pijperi]|uniref:Uncharacterized protein n=1 Tax=Wickerhamomyces pijperi TaxID=599730 RepID=A0A9P8QB02_WICPI|nr:hypothetical protein WICPIJ_001801 [Wickerhamomyces pijperi]